MLAPGMTCQLPCSRMSTYPAIELYCELALSPIDDSRHRPSYKQAAAVTSPTQLPARTVVTRTLKLFAPTRLTVANVIQAGTGRAWRGWRCRGPTSRYVPSTARAAVGSTQRRKPTATRAERITELDGSCRGRAWGAASPETTRHIPAAMARSSDALRRARGLRQARTRIDDLSGWPRRRVRAGQCRRRRDRQVKVGPRSQTGSCAQ